MRELLLIKYRANPTNENFNSLVKEYTPWLNATAIITLKKFPSISDTYLDDLFNEGLISIHNSARRFMWVCNCCDKSFIHLSDLNKHAKEFHSMRGNVKLIKISKYTEYLVKMNMKRFLIRIIKNSIVNNLEVTKIIDIEDIIASEIVIRNAEEKMTQDAKKILKYIFSLSKPNKIIKYKSECQEIKNLLSDLSHYG
jgi:hypothetical protein